MNITGREELKQKFKTGCIPTESDYAALIDASLNLFDDKNLLESEEPEQQSIGSVNTSDALRVSSTLDRNTQTPPEKDLKLFSDSLTFGGINQGREINSAQVSAGYHVKNSLNIVGMAANSDAKTRRIDMWAEAGLYIYTSTLHLGGQVFCHGVNVSKNVPNHLETDGSLYRYRGQVYITVDDNLYIRDQRGDTPFHFDTNNGQLINKGINFSLPRNNHLEADGTFYRFKGQAYLTVDDNFYIRDQGSEIKFFFDTNSSRLSLGVQNNGKAQLSLGAWNAGPSGPEKDGSSQLLLSGKHNTGVNKGSKNGTYKLKIEGYENDGATVYPIYCMDENSNVDFWIKNRKTANEPPTAYFAGFMQQKECAFYAQYSPDALVKPQQALKFDKPLFNLGGYFDSKTGKFVAPIKGVYQFTLDVCVISEDESYRWYLMNGGKTVYGEAPIEGAEACLEICQGNNCRTFLVNLEKGHEVYVKQEGSGRLAVNNCGFSGSLVNALVG